MESNKKIKCYICNLEISKTNWSKHIKTKKHLDNIQLQRNNQESNISETYEVENLIQKHCGICNILVSENEWYQYLKSGNHKKNTKLLQNKLKDKVKSLNIIRPRKRHFSVIDFETNDYIVKKSEEALEGCFLT